MEVFLLAGVTGVPSEIEKIAALVRQIGPARVQLNTVYRPPAEDFAFGIPSDRMPCFAKLFPGRVDIICERERVGRGDAASNDAEQADILALLDRRPCTFENVASGLGIHSTEALKLLEKLVAAGKAGTHVVGGRTYYVPAGRDAAPPSGEGPLGQRE